MSNITHVAKLGEITGQTRVLYSELGEITGYPLLYPTDMKPLEAYFIRLMTVIVATMPSGIPTIIDQKVNQLLQLAPPPHE